MKTLKGIRLRQMKNILKDLFEGAAIFTLVIIVFFMASCKKEESVQPSANHASKQSALRNGGDVIAPQAVVITVIKIDHRGGKTLLPEYTVTVTSDGYLVYNGINNVYTKGTVISKLRADVFQNVKDLFTQFSFYQIRDTLESVPDVPVNSTYYQESIKARSKTLLDDGDRYPFILIQLRQKVENLLHISNYVNGESFPVYEDKVL